jgi:DNA-binding transcriptional ArsR family regulator
MVRFGKTQLEEVIMARQPELKSESSKLTTVLRAMGNAKRMRILNELADGRERSVSELESVMNSLSQSALSQHLGRLRRANIVRTRRKSQTIYYSIDDTDVLRILRLLEHIYTDDPTMQRTKH